MAGNSRTGLQNVSLAFGKNRIFHKDTLFVEEKEKVCITAPSGYGKSTFLNLLMGFQRPDSGEVFVLGQKLNRDSVREIRHRLSWLPQEVYIDAETGRELLMAPFNFRENRDQRPEDLRIKEALEELMLDVSLLDQSTDTLSGGQKQRLALASCILLGKPLLLLDEPTSALDDEAVEHVAEVLAGMEEITLISASHDERWLKNMDRVIDLTELSKNG